MKTQTIKALQELCDAIQRIAYSTEPENVLLLGKASDRLKRVLDEEPEAHQKLPNVIAVNHEIEST